MKDLLGQKILFVTAHPDDESYLAAGTMLQNHRAGGSSYVACATFGEKGKAHIRRRVTSRQLKAIRKKELLAVSKFLKVSGLLLPGLPDAELDTEPHQEIFYRKLLSFTEKIGPTLIISFGKDGISGHLDHITAGKTAKKVARKLRIRFLEFAAPPDLHKAIDAMKKRRKHGKYARSLKHRPHSFYLDVDSVSKMKALNYHKSQFGPEGPLAGLAPSIVRQFLTREYFSY